MLGTDLINQPCLCLIISREKRTNKTVDADETQTPHDTTGDVLPADKTLLEAGTKCQNLYTEVRKTFLKLVIHIIHNHVFKENIL